MHKPISPRIHGVLDYSTALAVAAAPRLLDFPPPARRLCHALATSYASLSALTDYPLAVRRTVPFKAHGAVELGLAAVLPAMPAVLGFESHRAARNLCLGLTVLTLVVASLTDWRARDQKRLIGTPAAS